MAARPFSPAFASIALVFAVVIAALCAWLAGAPVGDMQLVAWHVDGNGRRVGALFRLANGTTVDTSPRDEARVQAGRSHARLGTASTLRVVGAAGGRPRVALDMGTLHVRATPPGVLVEVGDTEVVAEHATGIVERASNGLARLIVERGLVHVVGHDRNVDVPAGMVSVIYPGIGPGAPHARDASDAFLEALEAVETLPATAIRRTIGIEVLVFEARPDDAVTLVSLLPRVDPTERRRIVERLAVLSPPPDGVTLDAAVGGDPTTIEAWRQSLLGTP